MELAFFPEGELGVLGRQNGFFLRRDMGISPNHRMSSTTPSKMTTLVTIADDMLKNLKMDPLSRPDLVDYAEDVLRHWIEGKVFVKDSRLNTDEDYAKHELERELIHTASYKRDELPSVYTVMDDGKVEMDMPLHAPAWAKAQQLGEAKTYERYSKIARRLQKRLVAKGIVKQEDLNDLKRFV